LYVSIKAHGIIPPPAPKVYEFELETVYTKPVENTIASLLSLRTIPVWTRKQDEQCKLPNRVQYRIEAGSVGSFASSFSPNGLLIAVGCIGSTSHVIKVYNYTTGDRLATLEGHQDMIYSLEWSQDSTDLLSCSSDGSARIWSFNNEMKLISSVTFTHPTYVYTATFHPIQSSSKTIYTSGYDGIIRAWTYTTHFSSDTSKPTLKLPAQGAIVNSICFNKEGNRLYSGDTNGNVKIWAQTDQSFECIKTVDTLHVSPE
jgi:jouberin